MDSQKTQNEDPRSPGESFSKSVEIMARLRSADGCPWDREQDFNSIRKYTLEETYEVLDAIEREDWPHLKDELGDLLLQVLFYAQMASEATYFTITDVTDGLNRKLIRRHPHVFGDAAAAAAGNVAAEPEDRWYRLCTGSAELGRDKSCRKASGSRTDKFATRFRPPVAAGNARSWKARIARGEVRIRLAGGRVGCLQSWPKRRRN